MDAIVKMDVSIVLGGSACVWLPMGHGMQPTQPTNSNRNEM